MKTLIVLALVICLGAARSYHKHGKFYCPYTGLFPHPYDCTKYISCVHGTAHYMYCPYGTAFNSYIGVCDHFNKFLCNCGYTKNPCKYGRKYGRKHGRKHGRKYYREEYYPHKKNCHKFLHCVHGVPKVRSCPSGLVWDNYKERCEWYSSHYYKRCYKKKYYKHDGN